MFAFVEGLVCTAGVHADCAVGILVAMAEVEGVSCVLEIASCDKEMGATHIACSFDHFISVLHVMLVLAELVIGQVGSDVE